MFPSFNEKLSVLKALCPNCGDFRERRAAGKWICREAPFLGFWEAARRRIANSDGLDDAGMTTGMPTRKEIWRITPSAAPPRCRAPGCFSLSVPGRFQKRTARRPSFFLRQGAYLLAFAAFLLSHLVTHSEQEMSPVTLRQVRPMSNRRSIP